MSRPVAIAAGLLTSAILLLAPNASAGDYPPVVPVLRIGLGPAFHLAPDAEKATELALDVTAGVNVATEDSFEKAAFVVGGELGYTYDGIGLHAFNFAASIGYGHPFAFVTYNPRLIAGSAHDDTALGMRNGITMHVLADMGSLELAHQFVNYNDLMHHDFRMVFGVNPAAFVYLLSFL